MATEQIQEIISDEAFRQVKQLQDQLKDTVKVFTDVATSAKAFDTVLRGAKGLQQLEKAISEGANAQQLLVEAGKKLIDTTDKIKTAQVAASDSLAAYKKQIKELSNEYEALSSSEQKDVQRKEEVRQKILSLAAAYSGQQKALQQAKKGIDAASTSYYELQNATDQLQRQLKNMPGAFNAETGAVNKNNKEAVAMAAQIKINNDLLKSYDAALGQHFRNVGNYGEAAKGLKNYFTYLTGFAGGAFIAASATRAMIGNNIKISDSLTEVQRVAGLTDAQVEKLFNDLKGEDTRTDLSGLLDLARIGAQLGVAKSDLAGFTKGLNELYVTIGNEIQGGPEQIATSLSKVINLLDIGKQYGVQRGLEKTGSAILAVGQAGIATGDYLADFAERVGGVAKVAHISLPDLLGYGASLQANGVTAELAGTNFTRLIVQLGRVPDKFYDIARAADPSLSLGKFTTYIDTDANKALQLFFKGLAKSSNSLTDFAKASQATGLPGQRVAQVLAAISTNMDDVARNTQIANAAFDAGTLILQQYKLKNDNLAGSWAQLKNEVAKITTDPDGGIGAFFKSLIQGATMGIKAVDGLFSSFQTLFGLVDKHSTTDYLSQFDAQIKDFRKFDKDSQKIIADETASEIKKAAGNLSQLQGKLFNLHSTNYLNPLNILTTPGTASNLKKQINEEKARIGYLNQLYDAQQKIIAGKKVLTSDEAKAAATDAGLLTIDDLKKEIADLNKELGKTDVNDKKAIKSILDRRAALQKELDEALKLAGKKSIYGLSSNSELKAEASEQISLDKKLRDQQKQNALAEAKAESAINAEKLQNDIATQQYIMNDANESLDNRLKAFKKYVANEKQVLETEKDNQIKALQDKAFAQALANKQQQAIVDARKKKGGPLTADQENTVVSTVVLTDADKKRVLATLTNQTEQIILQYKDKIGQFVQKLPGQSFNIVSAALGISTGNANNLVQEQADKQLEALNSSYAANLLTERQYNKQKEDIEFQTQLAILKNQITAQQKLIETSGATDQQIADSKKKLADLEMSLSDLTLAHMKDNEQEKQKAILDTASKIQEYGDNFFSILSNAAASTATAQKNALQDQIDAINTTKQTEIDAVNASLLSQQDKAAKITSINAASQAQTEELARRQQQIDQKQAKYDKAKAIFDIALGIPQAVIQALHDVPFPFNLVLAGIVGAMGATELAIAAATPIPTYAKGRKDGPAEVALVSEQGPELVQLPSGQQFLTPEKPSLAYIPEHAKVLPHVDTVRELMRQNAMRAAMEVPVLNERDFNDAYIQSMEREIKGMRNDIKRLDIRHTHFEWTERGVRKWEQKGAAYTRWVNKNIN